MHENSLSIVIPAFNEAGRLPPTLQRIRSYMIESNRRAEIIVVDDGSTDGTSDIVAAFAPEPLTLQLIRSTKNHGKGHVVRQGMLAATGELLLMSDADLSTPIEEIEKLLPWIERGCDIVIGSRDKPESLLDPPQPFTRRLLARSFRALRRRVLLAGLSDTQCGFKLFRSAVARDVFSQATVDGWLFDCEVLARAQRRGYRIQEVGVVWRNHPHTRVAVHREILRALPTLLSIRRRVGRM